MRGRYSAARGRRLTAYEQVLERFAASRAGGFAFVHLLGPLDRRLLPLTRGRLSLAVGAPVGVLETRGARSGRTRRVAVLYAVDGERLVLTASNAGRARHPAWLHNVRADPEVVFLTPERGWRRYRAHEAAGDEAARCWALVLDLYAGYAVYQRRARGREIRLIILEPGHRGVEMPPAT